MLAEIAQLSAANVCELILEHDTVVRDTVERELLADGGDLGRHPVAHRLRGDLDGVTDRPRRRAPVTLDEEMLEAEDRRSAVLRVVGERAQALDPTRHESQPEPPRETALPGGAGQIV